MGWLSWGVEGDWRFDSDPWTRRGDKGVRGFGQRVRPKPGEWTNVALIPCFCCPFFSEVVVRVLWLCPSQLLKHWNGSQHCPSQLLKHWNGSQHCPSQLLKHWNGSQHCPSQLLKQWNGSHHCPSQLLKQWNGSQHCPSQLLTQWNGSQHCPSQLLKETLKWLSALPLTVTERNIEMALSTAPHSYWKKHWNGSQHCPSQFRIRLVTTVQH